MHGPSWIQHGKMKVVLGICLVRFIIAMLLKGALCLCCCVAVLWGSVTVLPCVFGQGDGTSMFWCYMQMMTTMIL